MRRFILTSLAFFVLSLVIALATGCEIGEWPLGIDPAPTVQTDAPTETITPAPGLNPTPTQETGYDPGANDAESTEPPGN